MRKFWSEKVTAADSRVNTRETEESSIALIG